MIAAIGANRELGYGNQLIWKIPADLKRFGDITRGHPIIMGRKTYQSINRLLPGRTNIIITSDPNFKVEGAIIVNSIEEAIETAKSKPGSDEIFIIGGAQVYEQAIKLANKLYLTLINAEAPMADVFFPDYSEFSRVTFSQKRMEDSIEYQFLDLEK